MNLPIPTGGSVVEAAAYDCATCSDRGWRLSDDGGQGTAVRCECQSPANNRKLVRESMIAAGMRADELASAWGEWDKEHQPEPKFAREWLEAGLVGDVGTELSPWCLGLLGKPGRGKTKAAAVLMRIFIQLGGRAPLWVRVPEAFDLVQAERRTEAYLEQGSFEVRIRRAGLVIFDDFGIVHRANTGLMEATVCEWLAQRHRRHFLSVITCNAAKLEDIGAPRIESRIAEGVYREMEAATDYRDQTR